MALLLAAKGLDLEWCKTPDAGLPQPDVILFMRLSVDATAGRGGFGLERYESGAFQEKVLMQFNKLAEEARDKQAGLWVDVDASGSVEDVHQRVRDAILPALVGLETASGLPLKTLWQGASEMSSA